MTSRRRSGSVWRLAGPIIVSNVSVPLLGAVDTAVIGQLPEPHAIGGVAVGAIVFNVIYWGFGFLRMGTTGLAAQAQGAGDADEVLASFGRALLLALAFGLAIVALRRPLAWACFAVIDPSERVTELADAYYAIRVWGAPAALANYAVLGWFIGVQRTGLALLTQLAMNGANAALALWFVLGLGLGIEGVASATLISEVAAALLGLALVLASAGRRGGRWRLAPVFDGRRLKRLMAVNRDIFLRTLCLQAAFVLFTRVGARSGDVVLAANAVLLLFQSVMAYGLDGFAHAVETLAGNAFGARDRRRFRGAVKATTLWAFGVSGLFAAAYALLGATMIDLLAAAPEVRAAARLYLPWVVALPLVSVWSYQLDGIFIGTTRTADMRNAMAASLAAFVALLPPLVWALGNHGLWLAFLAFMAARAVTLAARYPRLEREVETRG